MKRILCLALLIVMTFLHSPTFGQWNWNKHFIDKNLDGADGIRVADMDGDNNLDVVASGYLARQVVWYEAPFWKKHIIDDNLDSASDIEVADMDGDDDLDVVASSYFGSNLVWYEAPTWTRHTIDNSAIGKQELKIADIDGDNDLDVVATCRDQNQVVWYEAPSWTKHTIVNNFYKPVGLDVVDMNGDNTVDVVVAGFEASVAWFEAPSWIKHVIVGPPYQDVCVADINGDDTLDVVVASRGNNSEDPDVVAWYEGSSWIQHIIDDSLDGPRFVETADLDGDNDLDVVATGYFGDDVVWYEAPSWTKHFIDDNLGQARQIQIYDMDSDHDLDVVVSGESSDQVVWYENLGKNIAYGITMEVSHKYFPSQGDTLIIRAQLANPKDHSVSAYAMINGDEHEFHDSIELFDDGLHGDSTASDNVWGGARWISGLEEAMYKVDLSSHDLTEGTIHYLHEPSLFTTIGPVEADAIDDKYIYERQYIKLVLHNKGSVTTATNLKVTISTTDPRVKAKEFPTKDFPDLAAETTDTSSFSYYFYYAEGYGPDSTIGNPIHFDYTISSDETPYWTDSLVILTDVDDEQLSTIPQEFALSQNYPNPFNPSTTFKYEIPKESYITLKVYDILGREVVTLVNREQKAGYYEVSWNAVNNSSGIYFYRIQAGDFVETKKMIFMK